VAFFNSTICVSWSELSPPPGGAENGLDYPWVRLSQQTFRLTCKGTGSPDIECVLEVYQIKSVLSERALRSHDYYFCLFIEILLFKVYSYYCENWY
jgi:hypothetical protein